MDPEAAEVKAAGGVVWRRGERGIEIAVVHRPRYDDWSLPEGQARPGESWEDGALREVEEEIGLRCRLGARAAADLLPRPQGPREGRPLLADGAASTARVRAQRRGRRAALAADPADAAALLTYAHDAELAARGRRGCEPRPLPRPARRLGAARRPGRHADGRQRDRGDGRLDALGRQRQPRRRCSPPRTRPTSWSTSARASVGALLGGDPRGVAFGPSMTAMTMRFVGRRRPHARAGRRDRLHAARPRRQRAPVGDRRRARRRDRALRRARAATRSSCPPRAVEAVLSRAHALGRGHRRLQRGRHGARPRRRSSPPPTPPARACTSTPSTPRRTAALDVAALGCDALACSAYKWFGPHIGDPVRRARSCSRSCGPDKLRPSPDEVPGPLGARHAAVRVAGRRARRRRLHAASSTATPSARTRSALLARRARRASARSTPSPLRRRRATARRR